MHLSRVIQDLTLVLFVVGCFSFSTLLVPWPAGLLLIGGWTLITFLPRRDTDQVWLALSAVFTTLVLVFYYSTGGL